MSTPSRFPVPPLPRVVLPWAVLLSLALAGCSGGSSGPSEEPSVPTTITAVEGSDLAAPAGTVLPEGPTVEIRDQNGDPVDQVSVTFQILEGGGDLPVAQRTTDTQGRARVPWILGRDPGAAQRLRASHGSLSVEFQAQAQEAVAGDVYYGRNQYTQYLAGELPLVISAPHGGHLEPAEIPDRTYGTMVTDRNTAELAMAIREAVEDLTGSLPHVIISRLDRAKLDPNRDLEEGAQGNPEAERAWWEFQTFIEEAEELVEETYGDGFYIDLHGHGHDLQRLELGYLLSATDLANTDGELASPAYANKSSVRALASSSGVSFPELIRGPGSLGTLMENQGIPAVPSQNQPNPGGNPYFTGGYNTVVHGSRDEGSVSGVQIECNYTGVRDTAMNRQAFAEALAQALADYFPAFFDREFQVVAPAAAGG